MNQQKISKTVVAAMLLFFLAALSIGVENYDEDFEGLFVGDYPDPWNQSQSSCSFSNCDDGYGMVTDNNTNTMECLERTAATRHCFFEIDVEPGSNISLDYQLHVSSDNSSSEIVVFRNNSGYNQLNQIDGLIQDNVNSENTDSGSITYELDSWAGGSVLFGAKVSGKGDGVGGSYAQMDNISLKDGGDAAAPTEMEKKVRDYDPNDRLVMGREVNSSYSYEIEDIYTPVDTALVIDSSGSMDGEIGDVKDAAKDYVDNTKTQKGDENSVIDFDDDAVIVQELTDSKSDAKNAIDSLEALMFDSTNTGAGIDKGHETLLDGNNPTSAMIVLADGKTQIENLDVETQADQARQDGIAVHGVMYGGPPFNDDIKNEFEDITNSSCRESDENNDSDTCWVADGGNIEDVYQDIREELTLERSANLWMSLPGYTYPLSGYDYNVSSGGRELFVREDINISAGNHTESFIWAPLDYGDDQLIDNDESLIEYSEGDDTTNYTFNREIVRDIRYVDFGIPEYSLVRRPSGVNLSFVVENSGTALTLERETSLIDNSSNRETNYTVPRLGADDNESFIESSGSDKLFFDNSHLYFDNMEPLNLTVDPKGVWDFRPPGEGATLEPNENDNTVTLGYPAEREAIGPSSLTWNESFRFWIEGSHPQPSKLEAYFDFSKNGTAINSSDRMFKDVNGEKINFSTQKILPNTSEAYYNFSVSLNDSRGAVSLYNRSYHVDDPPPQVTALNPADGGLMADFPVDLEVYVEDRSSNKINVSFYSGQTGDQIYNESFVDSGSDVDAVWTPSDTSQTYYSWIVNATDNHSSSISTFTFRKTTGRLYRNDIDFEMNYSSVVMSAGENRIVQLNVTNNVLSTKNITLSLEGVDAEFLDGSDSKNLPDFPQLSSKTFTVRLTPGNKTEEDLEVVSYDKELGLETRESLPVIAIPKSAVTADVPGLQLVHLLFLLAASTVLYSVRL